MGFEFSRLNPKVGGVSSSNYRVRRATLDDIGQLTALWESMLYPTPDLARRVTEFQVAEGPDGAVLGALGLQIAERQGRVHSEAFGDFALAEQLRPLLWETLKLRDDVDTIVSADKEFAVFMQSEKQRTEQVFRRARALKTFATVVAFILLFLVVGWGVSIFLRNPGLLRR